MSQRAVLLQHVRPVPGTQEREREQDKEGREGERKKKMREIEWRVWWGEEKKG